MKRNEGECFYDYQARRLMENQRVKKYLKGTTFHHSKIFGTYKKEK